MRISLFIPCYVDQFFPKVGLAMAAILKRLGHEVHFPRDQTCCGQPAFNMGNHDEARRVAAHCLRAFRGAEIVAVPSGSCAAMIRVFDRDLFSGGPQAAEAESLASRTFEFSELLVDRLGVTDVDARFPHRVTFHDGCHGLRELGVKRQPRTLLSHVRGLELVEMDEAETCCGFGGAFSVKFASISTSMAEVKAQSVAHSRAAYVVSNDSSCLMQLGGLMSRRGSSVKCIHLAEVLASQ